MNKTFLAGMVFLACMCTSIEAQVLGKIDYIEGGISITRNGANVSKVDIGTPIENLDLIKTSKDGLVSITFDKASGLTGSVQIIAGSTALLRQDQLSGTSANEIQLIAGSVDLKVKRLAGMKSSVQVRTPSSVLGVRGTQFVVASFNGSALVACKEGEVFCTSTESNAGKADNAGKSSVPGTLVEILESGDLNTGAFPEGDFEKNWGDVQNKWKTFNVDLFVADPVTFMNSFTTNWSLYSAKVVNHTKLLRSNTVLQKWLKNAEAGKDPAGNLGDWVKEKPSVMKDLISIRPDMVIAMITWYRLQELIPYVPLSEMNRTLAGGQTVKSFISEFNKSSIDVSNAASLFYAAEKQYMLRNDGVSPFSEF